MNPSVVGAVGNLGVIVGSLGRFVWPVRGQSESASLRARRSASEPMVNYRFGDSGSLNWSFHQRPVSCVGGVFGFWKMIEIE